jgi:uncharacterized membrane protein YqiK
VKAEEQVRTAQEEEIANRAKSIAVIKATEEAEEKAVGVKIAAEAEKSAAADTAAAKKLDAQGEADAIMVKADADERRYTVDAEGKEKLNEAENKLSAEIIRMRVQLETISNLQGVIEASVKPMESIEGMKIINVSGLGVGGSGGSSSGGSGSSDNGNIADQLINGLLKYRAQAPILDAVLKEVNLDASSLQGLVKPAVEQIGAPSPEPVAETPQPAEPVAAQPAPQQKRPAQQPPQQGRGPAPRQPSPEVRSANGLL